jgi:hypothetical protein
VQHSGGHGVFGGRVVEREDLEDLAQVALAAIRAEARVDGLFAEEALEVGDVGRLWLVEAEQGAAGGEVGLAPTAAKQTVVADLVEAGRQDVLQESADEFRPGQAHGFLRLGALGVFDAVVAVAEDDAVGIDGKDAVVGDGDAIHRAPEVADEVLGAVERGFGIHDPGVAVQADQQLLPVGLVVQFGRAVAELAGGAQGFEFAQEDGSEDRREGADREQEVVRRLHKTAAIAFQCAAGDEAMHMRVQL